MPKLLYYIVVENWCVVVVVVTMNWRMSRQIVMCDREYCFWFVDFACNIGFVCCLEFVTIFLLEWDFLIEMTTNKFSNSFRKLSSELRINENPIN